MDENLVLLSIPALREQDLVEMPKLTSRMTDRSILIPSFPCVTWPVQANMLTGQLPNRHGVVANGFFWRESAQVEMWTAWNERIELPQIWDLLHQRGETLTSAAWFPMLSKGCGADHVCMPAPVHNPDGSESLWCYTKPPHYYGELRDELGHFPLQHFWGPMANIRSSAWIIDSAVLAARQYRPRFFYIYLPHLDYAAQKEGPDSAAAVGAVRELDEALGRLIDGLDDAYGKAPLSWIAASEYVVTPVNHVSYPNRVLRDAGLLRVTPSEAGELIDFQSSQAWALVDHQFSHVYVRDNVPTVIKRVVELFQGQAGISEVLVGPQRSKYSIDHARSGEVVLISDPTSWQAYYWWHSDVDAPSFARGVDIHRKPGYDPVELHFDPITKSIPLDASLVRGSHGAPARDQQQQGVALASRAGLIPAVPLRDIDIASRVLSPLGIN